MHLEFFQFQDNMNYTTNYKISNISVINNREEFQNLVIQVEVICTIEIEQLNKTIEIPLCSLLSIPSTGENYIPFENISKEKYIEWVLENNQHKIDMIVNRYFEIENLNQQNSQNVKQNVVVKTFTENELGNIEISNVRNILEQQIEDSID